MSQRAPLDVFLVAGEASGDQLGAGLMAALSVRCGGKVRFRGVGGPAMAAEGLKSQFPMDDLTAIGLGPIFAKLPTILRRLRETVGAIVAAPPNILVLIDSPDFTHRVAKRVRRALQDLPIVKYVSPTVWVWRPGRARAMQPYIDHILALFPFEPEVHRKLGGPPCTYVGHPLLEKLLELRPSAGDLARREQEPPLVLVLPGSRRSELKRLSSIFGEVAGRVAAAHGPIEFVLPTLPRLAEEIAARVASWPVKPRVVASEAEKYSAFRRARAALAASGTVTLELAVAGVPSVVAYRLSHFEAVIAWFMIRVPSVVLANIVLGENVMPEFLQLRARAALLVPALTRLLKDTPERRRQVEAFKKLDRLMGIGGEAPSARAARAVIETFEAKTGRKAPRS